MGEIRCLLTHQFDGRYYRRRYSKIGILCNISQWTARLFSFKNHLLRGLTMSIVGRSEGCDLRHVSLYFIGHVGGRYARSDLQYSLFTITDVIKNA